MLAQFISTRPPLMLRHQAAHRLYTTNDPCQLASVLERWQWTRQRPHRREAYRLINGENVISISVGASVVALGPGAVATLHLLSMEVLR